MKHLLSICTGVNLEPESSEKEFRAIKAIGYDAVDYQTLCTEPGTGLFAMNASEFERFLIHDREAAKDAGLVIGQTHGVWPYDDTKPENYDAKLEAMLKSIEATSILGAPYVVIHPVLPTMWNPSDHHEKDLEANIEYVKKLEPYARKYNVKLALENMPNPHVPCGHVSELNDCLNAVNSDFVVACMDVGHCSAISDSAGDMARLLGDKLCVLHIHDNDGRRDIHMPPYQGVTDWADFAKALREIGYRGTLSLETTSKSKFPNLPDSLRPDIDRFIFKTLCHIRDMAS